MLEERGALERMGMWAWSWELGWGKQTGRWEGLPQPQEIPASAERFQAIPSASWVAR